MAKNDEAMEMLELRLDNLEKEVVRWKFIGIGIAALAGFLASIGMWWFRPPALVRARGFLVVDGKGAPRAGIGFRDVEKNSVGLWICDGTSKNRTVAVGVGEDGAPSVTLYDAAGKMRALLGLTDKDEPSFMLLDKTEAAIMASPHLEGKFRLGIFDNKGKVVWKAP